MGWKLESRSAGALANKGSSFGCMLSMDAISMTIVSPHPRKSLPAKCSLSSSFNPSIFTFPLSTNANAIPNLNSLSLSSSSAVTSSTLQIKASFAAGSSNVELEAESARVVGKNDLLIVGPGVLGRLVAQKWKEDHPGCQVYGQTVTTNHHEELIQMGITPSLKGTKLPFQFPYVIFCAPPSRSADYPSEVREAASSWNGEGCFIFTSSSAPYDCDDNGFCDESTPSVPIGRNPRTDVLLKAEKVVLDNDGCVLRLAGLYTADRGAHNYWLQKGIVEARPDHILNMIHYEDAASLAVAILKKNLRTRTFLGCDNHPLSREEVMDLVNRSGKFKEKFQAFTGTTGPLGKRLNNSKTRSEIGWEPKYPSFAYFLETM